MSVVKADSLEAAILNTLLYADVFSFPLTVPEIHHFLIHDRAVSLTEVECALRESDWLRQRVSRVNGYVALCGRDDLHDLRETREAISQQLWPKAIRYGRWLSRLPFVRMVALTGALAMRNAPAEDDDLDYFVVTAPGRVWMARGFAVLLVRLARLGGVEVCPNYVVAETALSQNRHDVFMAHEVVQVVPLYGNGLYDRVRAENAWVDAFLPNAAVPFYDVREQSPGRIWIVLKRAAEALLAGGLGDRIEHWEYRRKLRRFSAQMQTPHSAAQVDDERVKGHFHDHGHSILEQYRERLRAFGLADEPLAGGD